MMNQRGFGLVQVLVTVAIMGIVMTAVATMMTTQMQETRAMNDKLAALDVQRNLSALLAIGGVCTYNLERASVLGPYNFGAGDGSPSRPFPNISLGTSLASSKPVAGAAETIAYRVTTNPLSANRSDLFPASVISMSLYVKEINLRIRCDAPPCDYSAATEVPAYYEMVYQDAGLVRSIAPARAAITLAVTGAGPIKNITGCYGDKPPGITLKQDTCLDVQINNCEYAPCDCPVGYYARGLQVGIRLYANYAVNTWSKIRCCLPD